MVNRTKVKLSTTERGLGGDHQKRRRLLLPYAYDTPCPLCGRLMLKGQFLDLDHEIPRVLGGTDGPVRITHRSCNRRLGARLAGRLRSRDNRVRSRW
jgi:hypothetical protein